MFDLYQDKVLKWRKLYYYIDILFTLISKSKNLKNVTKGRNTKFLKISDENNNSKFCLNKLTKKRSRHHDQNTFF